ncbi:protein angel homolog 2 isoform X2 [Cryptotermes secundus]|uniref:protein angel homolog 2 isoform X2 n=1 Tax=Cryptotermes secundus TaxID=105785 RepID=UPI000CD7B2A4|nr:protein angel homolog 2 isoform X2 [Cryptotermes secundus]
MCENVKCGEFLPCNVRNAAHLSSSLIKSHLPNPSSDTLQNENVIMPKTKRRKVNWNKLFKKINSERKKQRTENSPDCLKPEASCSVPESAGSKDSGIDIVFDSKIEKNKEPVLITVASDENKDTVSNMAASNSLVCDSAVQHNQGSWYCSVANWAGGSTCYADIQGSYSSKLVFQNEPDNLNSVQSGDGQLESAAGSSRQAGLSERNRLKEKRQWQYTQFGSTLRASAADATPYQLLFTIMSYNILAQELLESHQYLYQWHEPSALKWRHRKQILLSEIQEANADILCLQEVQANQLRTLSHKLTGLGYKGIYKRRTGNNIDGVAIYYKTDVFQLADHTSVEYFQPGIDVLDRHNVGLIAKLAMKANPRKHLVVATTHLLFNRNRHDVKLAQTMMLLAEVERFAFESFRSGIPTYWPVIITGDMNFQPYTGVYRLLTEGMFRYEGLSNRTLTYDFRGWTLNKIILPRSLNILDTCQHWGILTKRQVEQLSHKAELKFLKIYNTDHQKIIKKLKKKQMKSEKHKSSEGLVQDASMSGLGNNSVTFQPNTIPPLPEAGYGTGQVTHNLNLQSVYKHGEMGNYHESEVTTNQEGWVTVDYIFYSCIKNETDDKMIEGDLKLVSRYRLLTASEAASFGPIPNSASASDHYPLLATFFHTF